MSEQTPPAVLIEAATRFGTTVDDLHPLSGGHCAHVFGFAGDSAECILRIVPETDEMTAQAARSVLAWVRFLAANNGPVAHPVSSDSGLHLEVIKHGVRHYLVSGSRRAPGILGELLTEEQWTPAMYEALGRATGRMHSLARSYDPEDALRRPSWDQIGNCFNPDQVLLAPHLLIAKRRAEVLELVGTLPKTADGYGLIHADLHAANFFIDPTAGTITIFDFDDCCNGWYAMDVAMAIFDFAVLYPHLERDDTAIDMMARYWCGYRAEHELAACWIEEVPRFLKLLEIGVYIDVCQSHDPADTHSWVGKFMKGRRRRIEDAVPYLDVDLARLVREP